jgi:hypothetical protein
LATDINVTEDNSAFAGRSLTRWPVYTKKADCLRDLMGALGGEDPCTADVLQRLSNTDTSTWTDKGSRVN